MRWLAGTVLAAGTVFALPPNPVHWTVAGPRVPARAGATLVLTLTGRVDPGWHVYALEEPEGGPVPTQVGLAEGDPLVLLDVNEPPPMMVQDPVLRQKAGMFQNAVEFTLRVRAPRTPVVAGAVSHVMVRYQSCNEQVCLPPRTETLALPLAGVVR